MQGEKDFRYGSHLFLNPVATFAESAVRGAVEDKDEIRQMLHEELDKALEQVSKWDDDKLYLETVRINIFADAIEAVVRGKIAEKMVAEEEKEGDIDGNYS